MVPKYQDGDEVQLITENLKFVKIHPKCFFSFKFWARTFACVVYMSMDYTEPSVVQQSLHVRQWQAYTRHVWWSNITFIMYKVYKRVKLSDQMHMLISWLTGYTYMYYFVNFAMSWLKYFCSIIPVPQKPPNMEITKQPRSWYSFFCNRWLSLFGVSFLFVRFLAPVGQPNQLWEVTGSDSQPCLEKTCLRGLRPGKTHSASETS